MMNNQSGPSVTGRFSVDVSPVLRQTQAMQRGVASAMKTVATAGTQGLRKLDTSATGVSASFTQMQTSVTRSVKNIQASVSGTLTRMEPEFNAFNSVVDQSRMSLLAFTAAAGGLTYLGLQAADNVRMLNVRYRELASSEEEAAKLMLTVESAAKKVGIPVRRAQQDFAGLIPAIRDANGDIEEYIALALRMATLNPSEGVSGAVFAMREAMVSGGTDLVSLSERFNIPRKALRELIAETGNFGKALDIMLARQGATQAAAEASAIGLNNLANVIGDTLTRKLEGPFNIAMQLASKALQGLNALLEAAPEWMYALGAASVVAVGALAAMTLGATAAASAYFNLSKAIAATNQTAIGGKALSMISGAGRLVASAGVLGVAAVVGGMLGMEAVRGIGRATGNEELANKSWEDIGRTAQEIIGIFLYGLTEVGKAIANVMLPVITIISNFGNTLSYVGNWLKRVFGSVVEAIGNALNQMSFLGIDGTGLFEAGKEMVREAEQAMSEASAIITSDYEQRVTAMNRRHLEMQAELIGMFRTSTEETVEEVKKVASDAVQYLQAARAAVFVAMFDERLSFAQSLDELMESGEPKAINDRIDALEREYRIVNEMLPDLEKHTAALAAMQSENEAYAEMHKEASEALAGYRQRLEVIAEQVPQLVEALGQRTSAALIDLQKGYDDALADLEDKRLADIYKINDKATKDAIKLEKDRDKRQETLLEKASEDLEKYHDKIEELEQKHRDTLEKINKQYNQSVLEATAALDFAAVAQARVRRDEALSEAEKQTQEARDEEVKRARDAQTQRAKEMLELQTNHAERLEEIKKARQEELDTLNEAFAADQENLLDKLTQDTELLNTAHAEQLAQLQQYLDHTQQVENDARVARYRLVVQEIETRNQATQAFVNDAEFLADRLSTFGRQMREAAPVVSPMAPSNITPQAIQNAMQQGNNLRNSSVNTWANTFNISGAQDPTVVSNAVRNELVRLARVGAGGY